MTTILVSVLLRSNLEWMSILRLMQQTPIADHHSSRDNAFDREDGSQLLAQFSARNDAIIIRGVYDVATDTSVETRKFEGKLDALVNLVTQLPVNQKSASVARVCGIRSSNDHHTSQFRARNDVIIIRGVHDVVTDTSVETRKLECKLDALVNLVTQLAAKQKPASVARVCGSRSSNDHHTSEFSARNDAILIRGVHGVATDISAETRKLEGKLDALVNLVTQLAVNQNLPLLQESTISVLRMTTTLVSVLRRSNLEWTSILRLTLQTRIADHHNSRDKALDRANGSQLLVVQCKK
ncbi:hypothetical protein Fmac_021012 [Flemingia macrophylla]|uniref:Uncharacterized protein n=1 Tax=Flemingia macrophylla TaxID=520843 RepID=A0ABD1LVL3_9FABA